METLSIRTWNITEAGAELRDRILGKHCDINVDHCDWYDYICEDAEKVRLKIMEFDLGRRASCKAQFLDSAEETARAIMDEHGKHCSTYQTATGYLSERAKLVAKYSDGVDIERVHEDNEYEFDQACDAIDSELLRAISEDYRIMLQHEYEYLTSDEAVLETLEANEYRFDCYGDIVVAH